MALLAVVCNQAVIRLVTRRNEVIYASQQSVLTNTAEKLGMNNVWVYGVTDLCDRPRSKAITGRIGDRPQDIVRIAVVPLDIRGHLNNANVHSASLAIIVAQILDSGWVGVAACVPLVVAVVPLEKRDIRIIVATLNGVGRRLAHKAHVVIQLLAVDGGVRGKAWNFYGVDLTRAGKLKEHINGNVDGTCSGDAKVQNGIVLIAGVCDGRSSTSIKAGYSPDSDGGGRAWIAFVAFYTVAFFSFKISRSNAIF